jgi:hypothetical protein
VCGVEVECEDGILYAGDSAMSYISDTSLSTYSRVVICERCVCVCVPKTITFKVNISCVSGYVVIRN